LGTLYWQRLFRVGCICLGLSYEANLIPLTQLIEIAKTVMAELKVPVNDLHTALSKPSSPHTTETLIGNDGVHLTSQAKELLGKQVAAFVGKYLKREPK